MRHPPSDRLNGPPRQSRRGGRRNASVWLSVGKRLADVAFVLPQDGAELLAAAVKSRITTIISGGTGSGKTTMLNALSAFISEKERLITIEDAAELQLQQPHVVRLETRPPNLEGQGQITMRDLVKNCLRMRPERIIVGDTRPDLTLILDVPAKEGMKRAAERRGQAGADRFEGEALAFHEKLRDGFLTLAASEPDRCVLIDATLPKEEVSEQIWRVVMKKLDPSSAPVAFEDFKI